MVPYQNVLYWVIIEPHPLRSIPAQRLHIVQDRPLSLPRTAANVTSAKGLGLLCGSIFAVILSDNSEVSTSEDRTAY